MSNSPTPEQLKQAARKANQMQREVMGMSNQDRLLSDEELTEKIGNVLDDLLNTEMPARFNNTDWAEYTITNLINTQKKLYAESVITPPSTKDIKPDWVEISTTSDYSIVVETREKMLKLFRKRIK